jgi:hypothetical protein
VVKPRRHPLSDEPLRCPVIALGAMLVCTSFVAPPSTTEADLLMRLGGAFVAAVSAFPLSQYLERRDRMTNVRVLKAKSA